MAPLLMLAGVSTLARAEESLMSPESFLETAFADQSPQSKLLVLPAPLRAQALQVLGHPYAGMRVRYWWRDGKSAWIIDEIGKERPITLGLVVAQNRIQSVDVLVYREERGGEIRLPSFREQFRQASLNADDSLDRDIDGISGATLSVEAVGRVARLVLLFHRHVAAGAS